MASCQQQTRLLKSLPNRRHTEGPVILVVVSTRKYLCDKVRYETWSGVIDGDERVHQQRIVTWGFSERGGFGSCR